MTLNQLYDIAEKDNITVFSFQMEENESVSLLHDNKCFVAIDPFRLKSSYDEKAKLAHEIGHCETGAFYNQYSPFDIRSRHEYRADKWAIKKLVPKDELIKAIKDGCENSYELSEHFGVPQWFMDKALAFYFS